MARVRPPAREEYYMTKLERASIRRAIRLIRDDHLYQSAIDLLTAIMKLRPKRPGKDRPGYRIRSAWERPTARQSECIR